MIIIGLVITIALAAIGFVKKESKILFCFQLIWLWILTGLNNGGLDYAVNCNIYKESPNVLFTRFSYFIQDGLGTIALNYGVSFEVYNALLAVLCTLIIYYVVRKHSIYPCLTMSLFYIAPMIDSVIQKRFYVSMCIMLLAFSAWIEKKVSLYYIFTIIAIGFHFSAVLYLVFPIFDRIIHGHEKRAYFFLILELFGYGLLDKIMVYTPFAEKYYTYSQEQRFSSPLIGVLYFSLQCFYIVMILLIRKYRKSTLDSSNNKICELNIDSILLLPLIFKGSTWNRYFRALQIYNYTFIGKMIFDSKNKRVISYLCGCAFAFILLLAEIVTKAAAAGGLKSFLDSAFTYNAFLQLITHGRIIPEL